MKVTDFKEVEKLLVIRARCEKAIHAGEDADHMYEEDSGGIEGFSHGYWGQFCEHSDGNGWKMDLNGCYVAVDVIPAILEILRSQVSRVNKRLVELGVDPNA